MLGGFFPSKPADQHHLRQDRRPAQRTLLAAPGAAIHNLPVFCGRQRRPLKVSILEAPAAGEDQVVEMDLTGPPGGILNHPIVEAYAALEAPLEVPAGLENHVRHQRDAPAVKFFLIVNRLMLNFDFGSRCTSN